MKGHNQITKLLIEMPQDGSVNISARTAATASLRAFSRRSKLASQSTACPARPARRRRAQDVLGGLLFHHVDQIVDGDDAEHATHVVDEGRDKS
jgi:hypothetical protein